MPTREERLESLTMPPAGDDDPEGDDRPEMEPESARREEASRLDGRILEAVELGWEAPLPERELDALARDLFLHQRRHNAAARAWWDAGGVDEYHVRGWRDVPPLPVAAWRLGHVAAFPVEPGQPATFLSSGTTSSSRSQVFVEGLNLYEAALVAGFRRHALADRERIRLLFLTPPPERAPQSSLIHMFAVLRRELGEPGSAFLAPGDAPEGASFNPASRPMASALAALSRAAAEGEPVFLLGPAFAFVHVLDALRSRGARLRLPAGSRLFQTGGFKGRSREVSPVELLAAYEEVLGVPRGRVVNEYGMAELASQFYAGPEGRYASPPWVRWQVLDPLTLEPASEGTPGVLAVWDLANRSSCFALRSEDLALARGGTFELLGRLAGSEPRGCSVEADTALTGNGPRQSPGPGARG